MNTVSEKSEIKAVGKYTAMTVCLYVCFLLALYYIGAIDGVSLAITLAAALLLTGIGLWLRAAGHSAVHPALTAAALLSYAAVCTMALGKFTWLSQTSVMLHLFGFCWCWALVLFSYAVIGRVVYTVIASGAVFTVFGIANYAMLQFRGRMFLAGDITALKTAAGVADNYSLDISAALILAILLEVSGCALAAVLAGRKLMPNRKTRTLTRAAAMMLALGYAVFMGVSGITDRLGIRLTWNQNDFEESPVLYFAQSLTQLSMDEPEGYSTDALKEISDSVVNNSTDNGIAPHIIVVMNESFADLGRIGELETSTEITPFIDSLTENTVRGYVYSSVYGGGTADSEFEFLTGCTMAFIPKGCTPYQQYIHYDKESLVSVLETQGYTSMVLHPYDSDGWNRVAVYDCLGFDETYFIDDFIGKSYLRGYVDDESNYYELLRRFEQREDGERMFIYNITMQNHGSYKNKTYSSTVSISGHEGEFPIAEQYLSLLRETDAATEMFIEYFSAQDEPVIILFFGDHQPDLEDGFYDMLYGKTESELTLEEKQRKQLTPFFIWANYDIDEYNVADTSINYLSSLLLETAGLETSDFQAFLSDVRGEWPAINASGFVDSSGYHILGDTAGKSELVQRYRMLQYNYLFDTDGYLTEFFGLN